jgi:hypothetical protein
MFSGGTRAGIAYSPSPCIRLPRNDPVVPTRPSRALLTSHVDTPRIGRSVVDLRFFEHCSHSPVGPAVPPHAQCAATIRDGTAQTTSRFDAEPSLMLWRTAASDLLGEFHLHVCVCAGRALCFREFILLNPAALAHSPVFVFRAASTIA